MIKLSFTIILLVLLICLLPEQYIMAINTANLRAYWAALNLFWQKQNPYEQAALSGLITQYIQTSGVVENIWHLPAIFVFPLYASLGSYVYFLRLEILITLLPYLICCYLLIKSFDASTPIRKQPARLNFVLLLFLGTFHPAVQSVALSPYTNLALLFFILFLNFETAVTRRDKLLAGLFLSMTFVKPPVLYLVYTHFLFKNLLLRNYASILGFILGLLLLLTLPVIFNPNIYSYYLELLINPPMDWLNPNISTWLQVQSGSFANFTRYGVMSLAIIIYFTAQFRYFLKSKTFIRFEILAAYSLISTNYLWGYDFVFLLPLLCSIFTAASVIYENSQSKLFASMVMAAMIVMNLVPAFSAASIFSHYFVWYPLSAILLYLLSRSAKNYAANVGNK